VNNYLEIKRHKNKPEQRFRCELLHRESGYAVLRYVAEKSGLIAAMSIAPGSTTVAHYWQDRPYVAWRMFDLKKNLIGTLFHICTNVCIREDHLSYDDLLLDIWIMPDGKIRVLDEDELQACITTGLVSNAELFHIRKAQHCITALHKEIITGLAAFDCTPAHTLPPTPA
jgi:predicted RNA-binding protein associated with RNAse of E/G family